MCGEYDSLQRRHFKLVAENNNCVNFVLTAIGKLQQNMETNDYYEGHDQLSRPSITKKGFTVEYLAREIFAKVATKIIYLFCDEIRVVFIFAENAQGSKFAT
jgi:hypothetical protein